MAVTGDPRGYYRALGVERTASADDIRTAFRQRAKSLHPDQSGGAAGNEGFHLLLEAYEALRDPQARLRYDAASLGAGEPAADAPLASDETDGNWLARRIAANPIPLLAGALGVAVLLAVLGWTRAAEHERVAAGLAQRLEAAAVTAARPTESEPPRLYRTEFRFPAGIAELDATGRARLASIAADLRRRIADLPSGSEWLIAVEGTIERAADGRGPLVAAWELALLRVGVTAQYLVGQGIPPERVSVRFHAGALGPQRGRGRPHAVALSLVCCLADPLGG